MEKIVGSICIGKKNSNISFNVKWNSEEETAWISISAIWVLVCTKVKTTNAALLCVQEYFAFNGSLGVIKK